MEACSRAHFFRKKQKRKWFLRDILYFLKKKYDLLIDVLIAHHNFLHEYSRAQEICKFENMRNQCDRMREWISPDNDADLSVFITNY